MLLKWITIQPTDEGRAAFIAGQDDWKALAAVPGFLWQIAGWSGDDETMFGALALWESPEQYREFMTNDHDRIGIHQVGTFKLVEGLLSEVRMTIGNSHLPFPSPASRYLRVADCRLLPDSATRFWRVQKEIWNPGMSASPGMLGGFAAAALAEANRCIVATAWQSHEHHLRYQQLVFPGLRSQAPAEDHLASVKGSRLRLVPNWRVVATHTEGMDEHVA